MEGRTSCSTDVQKSDIRRYVVAFVLSNTADKCSTHVLVHTIIDQATYPAKAVSFLALPWIPSKNVNVPGNGTHVSTRSAGDKRRDRREKVSTNLRWSSWAHLEEKKSIWNHIGSDGAEKRNTQVMYALYGM